MRAFDKVSDACHAKDASGGILCACGYGTAEVLPEITMSVKGLDAGG